MIIDIFGVIDEWYVSAKSIREQLNNRKDDEEIQVYINSPGGSVFEGLAIYNLLAEYKPIVKIIGEASSIASVIAMAGREIWMAETALMLIHKPWTFAWGNENDLDKIKENLKTIKNSILIAYQRRTQMSTDDLNELIDKEDYHDANACLDMNLIDKIYTPTADDMTRGAKAKNKNVIQYLNINKIGDYKMTIDELKEKLQKSEDLLNQYKDKTIELESKVENQKNTITQLESDREVLKNKTLALTEEVSTLKDEQVQNEVKMKVLELKEFILPAENNAENGFALEKELTILKKFDKDESTFINGKSMYDRKIEEIKNRKSLKGLFNKIEAAEPTAQFDGNIEDREALNLAVEELMKAKNLGYKDALNQILSGVK